MWTEFKFKLETSELVSITILVGNSKIAKELLQLPPFTKHKFNPKSMF